MFSSRQFIYDVYDIPSTWILETYLKLPYTLQGQTVKIKSIFNAKDTCPSLSLYYNKAYDRYSFKCFSSGNSGSAVTIMMELWKTDFARTSQRLIQEYTEYVKKGEKNVKRKIEAVENQIVDIKIRYWTNRDAKFWSNFNISSSILKEYNVKPLESYTLNKVNQSGTILKTYSFDNLRWAYGYFKKDGGLYKIYNPYNKEGKFFNINNEYIQGTDQLELGNDTLCIASSLKDIMTLRSINLKGLDYLAPGSENTLFNKDYLEDLFENREYRRAFTLFDNDDAGKKGMSTYKAEYGFGICLIPAENDVSEIMRVRRYNEAVRTIVPYINNTVEKIYKVKFNIKS